MTPRRPSVYVAMLIFVAFPVMVQAQRQPAPPGKTKPAKTSTPRAAPDPLAEAKRTTAIALVNTLADDARNFRDPLLRARIQARAADVLWNVEQERARGLFRRAWDAAETADRENDRLMEEQIRAQQAANGPVAFRPFPSLRGEVLRLAAKRDRALGEEFLNLLGEARKQEAATTPPADNAPPITNSRSGLDELLPAVTRRLRLARGLLDDGDVERAIQFADPALNSVNDLAIDFLSRLRPLDAAAADQRYAALLAAVAGDPSADANTVSLLSSYVFSPGFYITFATGGGASSRRLGEPVPPPDDIPPALRAAFFRAAASVLLRPVPPLDQDRSTSGRMGTYMVIARLLPLFEQHAPQNAAVLRTKLSTLTQDTPEDLRNPNNSAFTRGLTRGGGDGPRETIDEYLDRLDKAKTAAERDEIYLNAMQVAMRREPSRARELAGKIEDGDLRRQALAYVDYELSERALGRKDAAEALRIARGGELTTIQRVWLLTEVARILAKSEPGRATELLEEATTEARRIDPASPERPRALVAIATHFAGIDRPRAWEAVSEAVKAANAANGFTGEDGGIEVQLQSKRQVIRSGNDIDSFNLAGIFDLLTGEDLNRAIELAKSFANESPRAVAVLTIARAVLDGKKREPPRGETLQREVGVRD